VTFAHTHVRRNNKTEAGNWTDGSCSKGCVSFTHVVCLLSGYMRCITNRGTETRRQRGSRGFGSAHVAGLPTTLVNFTKSVSACKILR
jgi:hypothetical protein